MPLGAFLSGGVDSSAIVCAMGKLTDQPVKTFAIGFGHEEAYYNELSYAKIVADKFGTEHHELIVEPNMIEILPKLIWHMDEPIADSAFLTTFLISNLAKQHVSVALSGIGGDEIFGGYRRYLGESFLQYSRYIPKILRERWLPSILNKLPKDRHSPFANYVRYSDALLQSVNMAPEARYMSYISLFTPGCDNIFRQEQASSYQSVEGQESSNSVMSEYFKRGHNEEDVSQALYVDLKTSLPDDLLLLTDKMSMATSLECRAPFLDHELVELAYSMPSNLKIHGFKMKYLMKKALKPWLPDEILNRPKRGFGAPLGSWIRNELKFLIDETLSKSSIEKRGIFRWEFIHEKIASHQNRQSDSTDHLLALINFELWCRIFLDNGGNWEAVSDQLKQVSSS